MSGMVEKKTVVKKETTKKLKKTVEKTVKKTVVTPDAEKQAIINQFSTHPGDTGSPEVQVAILTWKIINLQKHLQVNQKDNHSRRGLLKIVSKRRRIMKYLRDKDEQQFIELEKKIKGYQASNK
jgi:small subunit ribosomal protein S15